MLRIRPVFKKQQQNFDRIYKCITHLIYLMLQTAGDEPERELLKESVTLLIRKNITSAGTNDTLLHLSVSRLNYIKHDIVRNQFPLRWLLGSDPQMPLSR